MQRLEDELNLCFQKCKLDSFAVGTPPIDWTPSNYTPKTNTKDISMSLCQSGFVLQHQMPWKEGATNEQEQARSRERGSSVILLVSRRVEAERSAQL